MLFVITAEAMQRPGKWQIESTKRTPNLKISGAKLRGSLVKWREKFEKKYFLKIVTMCGRGLAMIHEK